MTLSQLLQVVSSAKQEFIVLIGVVGVVILLVGTIMYFVEFQIPDVCYIAVYQQFISSFCVSSFLSVYFFLGNRNCLKWLSVCLLSWHNFITCL